MNATHVFNEATGQFFRARDMKPLGGKLLASGMTPAAFVASFWLGTLAE